MPPAENPESTEAGAATGAPPAPAAEPAAPAAEPVPDNGKDHGPALCHWCERPIDDHVAPCPGGVLEEPGAKRLAKWTRTLLAHLLEERQRGVALIESIRSQLVSLVEEHVELEEDDESDALQKAPLDELVALLNGVLRTQDEALEKGHATRIVFAQIAHLLQGREIPESLGEHHAYTRRLARLIEEHAHYVSMDGSRASAPRTVLVRAPCPLCCSEVNVARGGRPGMLKVVGATGAFVECQCPSCRDGQVMIPQEHREG